jgi:hypothetical protein
MLVPIGGRTIVPSPMVDLSPARFVAEFSDGVLAADLSALPPDRRAETVAFTEGRIAGLPSPMKLGVGAVAIAVGVAGRLVGTARIARLLARRPLPVVGDYVRLVRSLGYAYIWETWPATAADGAPR